MTEVSCYVIRIRFTFDVSLRFGIKLEVNTYGHHGYVSKLRVNFNVWV